MKALRFGWMIALLGVTALGCADDDDDTNKDKETAPLEVIGEWDGEFGEETITEDVWGFNGAIIEYDNATNIVITQNDDDAEFNPSAFSRIVYTQPEDDAFAYCITDFALETVEDAREANGTADADDLEGGCGEGGFPWTQLTAK